MQSPDGRGGVLALGRPAQTTGPDRARVPPGRTAGQDGGPGLRGAGGTAGAVDGDLGDVPLGALPDAAEGGGAAGARWLGGDPGAAWVDGDPWTGWVGAAPDGAEPGAPAAAPGADGPEPGWREPDGPEPGDVDEPGTGAPAAAGGRARCADAGSGPECPVSARAAAARPTTAAAAIQARADPLPVAEAR